MTEVFVIFAFLGILAAILANIAFWGRQGVWVKFGALAIVAILLPSGYFGLTEMLSRPKPIALEMARTELAEANVLGAQMEENKAIYLWLALPDTGEPRAYTLPWDKKLARQLRDAERDANETGTPVRMRRPFENSLDDREQRFYAAPPPPPPLKDAPVENPLNFQHSQPVQ